MSGGNDSFTKILLHMDGANAGTTFTDSNFGGSAHTWTAHTATTSTGTLKFGTAAGSFGSTGWIDTPDSSDFTLGSGDWTIECWFNRQGGDGARRLMCGQLASTGTAASTSAYVELSAANVVSMTVCASTVATSVTGTTTITTTGWHHVAAVRTGNVLKLFVDGTQEGGDVSFSSTVNDAADTYSVGRGGALTTLTWNGFIDEFRLSVGIARFTANFTPATAAYDIGFNGDVGAFAETGNAATFAVSQPSAVGSFSLSGQASTFATLFTAATATYLITGNAVFFTSPTRRALLRDGTYWKGRA